jgi:hypothetical protein
VVVESPPKEFKFQQPKGINVPGHFTAEQLANLDRLIDVKQQSLSDRFVLSDDADDVAEVSVEVAEVTVGVMEANAVVGDIAGAAAAAVAAGVAAGVAFVAAAFGDRAEFREKVLRNDASRRAFLDAIDAIPLDSLIEIRRAAIADQ